MNWVKTKNELPKDDTYDYLIFVDGQIAIADGIPARDGSWLHSSINKYTYTEKIVSFIPDEITHWAPLPEKPEI